MRGSTTALQRCCRRWRLKSAASYRFSAHRSLQLPATIADTRRWVARSEQVDLKGHLMYGMACALNVVAQALLHFVSVNIELCQGPDSLKTTAGKR